jgi:hypothetical protein
MTTSMRCFNIMNHELLIKLSLSYCFAVATQVYISLTVYVILFWFRVRRRIGTRLTAPRVCVRACPRVAVKQELAAPVNSNASSHTT